MKVFLGMIALFLVVVVGFVALFLYQGQAALRYGRAVLAAAPSPVREGPCRVAAPGLSVPAQVAECRVQVVGGHPEADLRLDSGRSFRVVLSH